MSKSYKDMWFELKVNTQGGIEYYSELSDIFSSSEDKEIHLALEVKKEHFKEFLSLILEIEKENSLTDISNTYHKGGCI